MDIPSVSNLTALYNFNSYTIDFIFHAFTCGFEIFN